MDVVDLLALVAEIHILNTDYLNIMNDEFFKSFERSSLYELGEEGRVENLQDISWTVIM